MPTEYQQTFKKMTDIENDTNEGATTEGQNGKAINNISSNDWSMYLRNSTPITIDQSSINHLSNYKPEIRRRDHFSHSCCNKLKGILVGIFRRCDVSR